MNKPDMSRAEALDVLEEVRGHVLPIVLSLELDAAIAALSSCACEGKEGETKAMTCPHQRGQDSRSCIGG